MLSVRDVEAWQNLWGLDPESGSNSLAEKDDDSSLVEFVALKIRPKHVLMIAFSHDT